MDCTDKTDLSTYKVHLWDVYNTLEDNYKCQSLQKSGKICNKKCGYKYNGIYSCKVHFPKNLLPIKKEHFFKPKLIKNYLLQDIATIILNKLNEIYNQHIQLFNQLTMVVIELQPSVNKSMIFVSHLIYGKFIDLQLNNYLSNNCTIKFVRASQKLKAYTGIEIVCPLKGKYAQRKWLSVRYTRWFLENKFSRVQKDVWFENFLNCGKADDRSDTFLMAINCLHGIPKKQKMNFKKNN